MTDDQFEMPMRTATTETTPTAPTSDVEMMSDREDKSSVDSLVVGGSGESRTRPSSRVDKHLALQEDDFEDTNEDINEVDDDDDDDEDDDKATIVTGTGNANRASAVATVQPATGKRAKHSSVANDSKNALENQLCT